MKLIDWTAVATAMMLGLLAAACTGAGDGTDEDVALRFAVFGDAEPKPEASFPNLDAAVEHVNTLAASGRVDFVVGVGDIAHKGTLVQYENATPVLQKLTVPFYPIMGNEEHESTVERFLEFANRWNNGRTELTSPRYVREHERVALVFASPDFSRDFEDEGIDWMKQQIRQLHPKPVLLIVHGAQTGVYPENADKGISNPRFAEIIAQPNLAAVISGDLHMDMDRVHHSKQIGEVHYLHIPGLERTKIPDETRHTPMFRVFTLDTAGEMQVDTWQAGVSEPLARHRYRFQLQSTPEQALRQTAYRVRADFDAALNADAGWAAETNMPAVVRADRPFRLRLEVESDAGATSERQFRLQFRHNDGEWEPLAAEDFPYPIKELALESGTRSAAGREAGWTLVRGDASALSRQRDDDEGFLRVTAQDGPVLALGDYQTHWEALEFKASLRLPESSTAGILFGYRDADNHYRLELEAEGAIRVIRRHDGRDSVLESNDIGVKAGQWIEAAVERDGSEVTVEYEWDAYIEGMEFTLDVGETVPESKTGLYVPANASADVRGLEISGETHTPRVSIVSSSRFEHGEETSDLLAGSRLPFSAGAGVSYADMTPPWSGSGAHGEWEVPIVIRYFSDHANVNEPGDTFEFRLVDVDGAPVTAARLPEVKLDVPEGHVGGTFVETPVRIGPWEATNGDLYFIMEPSETDNVMMVVKSTDGGYSWREVDGGNRPVTGDLEGVGSTYVDGRIHILHQTSDHVFYHRFRTSDGSQPDGWEIRDERLASPVEPPVQVADIAVRSDGSVVGVYGDLHKILVRSRSPEGVWGEETVVDAELDRHLSGPVVVLGKEDVVHLSYTGIDGTAWHRRILPNGQLTPRRQVASGLGTQVQDAGGILPLVYLAETDTVSIIYRLDNGELWERRVRSDGQLSEAMQVTRRAVVSNAADSEQVGADAVGYGADVHVLFIEESTGRLFHTWRAVDGDWREPTVEVDGEDVLWVRGTVVKRDEEGARYGYVYDGGSYGGSGMNRYAEVPLPAR